MPGRMPDFIIAGAMRSGTTSLHHWLSGHPGVFTPEAKELRYFNLHYDRGEEWYRSLFADARDDQVVGEASPQYMFNPLARERMQADVPDAKIVLTLRDPVERAWSHFNMMSSVGHETLPFEEALDREQERLGEDRGQARFGYVSVGRYAEHVHDLRERFGDDGVLVLIFERDVEEHAPATFGRLVEFIGAAPLDEVPETVGRHVNQAVAIRSRRLREISRRLPKPVQNAIGRVNSQPRTNATLPAGTRQRLREALAPATEALEQQLGFAIPEWSTSSSYRG